MHQLHCPLKQSYTLLSLLIANIFKGYAQVSSISLYYAAAAVAYICGERAHFSVQKVMP